MNKKDDEKLRKELIEYFRWNVKQILNNFNNKEVLAWVEKQGKKETNENEREIQFMEQNPIIIIPKFRPGDVIHLKDSCVEYTIKSISDGHYYGDGFSFNIVGCDRDYELIKHNSMWSEEDERYFSYTIHAVEDMLGWKNTVSWLKSLKNRIQAQLQQELSEEDKNKLNHIIKVINYNIKDGDYCYGHGGKDYLSKKEIINFLKSLRYYNTWLPSNEQIIALDNARHSNPFNIHILDTLFHDLNKLRRNSYA